MNNNLPPIYFYIPENKLPEQQWLQSPDTYSQWQIVKQSNFIGQYNWTLQTYLHLRADGFPCQLVGKIPNEGIILSHRWFLKNSIKPGTKQLIVCMQGDGNRHPYAQFYIVQNTRQASTNYRWTLWESHFIPHWTQPGLIPRDSSRGDKFENVAFFGTKSNLAPELQNSSWSEKLKSLGLNWQSKNTRAQWLDFSDVDVVLAIRKFDASSSYDWKPATKLYNAWHAGVPAILGRESAFLAERKSQLDYLEVISVDETISALQRLRDNPELRQAMIDNGRIRAKETSYKQMTAKWRSLIKERVLPAYQRWLATPRWQQQAFLKLRRYIDLKLQNLPSKTRQEYLAHTETAAKMKQQNLW